MKKLSLFLFLTILTFSSYAYNPKKLNLTKVINIPDVGRTMNEAVIDIVIYDVLNEQVTIQYLIGYKDSGDFIKCDSRRITLTGSDYTKFILDSKIDLDKIDDYLETYLAK